MRNKIIFLLTLVLLSCRKDEDIKPTDQPLSFTFLQKTLNAKPGDNISVEVKINNPNSEKVNGTLEFYLSRDSLSVAGAYLMDRFSIYINKKESSLNYLFQIPAQTDPGNYYIVGKYKNNQDSLKNPATFSYKMNVVSNNSDSKVILTTITTDKINYVSGEYATLSVGVTQQGIDPLLIRTFVYLSKDTIIDLGADLAIENSLLGSYDVLNENISVYSKNIKIPAAASGEYYILFKLIFADKTSNQFVTTQTVFTPVVVQGLDSMISISGISLAKKDIAVGESTGITINVNNYGNTVLNHLNIDLYLSYDKNLSSDDFKLSSLNAGTINPGEKIITANLNWPSELNTGKYNLLIFVTLADISGALPYIIEDVNIAEAPVTVKSLTIINSPLIPGSFVGISLGYLNELPSDYSVDYNIWLSKDNTFSLDDIKVKSSTMTALPADTSANITINLPSGNNNIISGEYFVIFQYKKSNNGNFVNFSSSAKIEVISNTVILYRNTFLPDYTGELYLFIDDQWVKTFTSYATKEFTDCSMFNQSAISYYYRSVIKPGNYTYKLRTVNDLIKGSTLKTGTFTVEGGCLIVDVD